MAGLWAESVPALAARVREGTLRASSLAERALAQSALHGPSLGAFLCLDADGARAAAARVDARVARGEDPGPLAGIPVAIKDNLCTAGLPTTCASRMLEGFRPEFDATAVRRLREAGAVILGKTNLDEFAMGSSGENSAFFPTRNPWDPARVPGGSSGGSAAAVAAGMAPVALGSDTGGSVRQPAAFCGLYAWKPTYGCVSRFGLVAYASSLDHVGVMARDPESLAAVAEAIAGPDPRDATCLRDAAVRGERWPDARGLEVGIASGLLALPGVERAVGEAALSAARALERAGATLREVDLGDPARALSAYYLLAAAEASSNLARYDGVRYGRRANAPGLDAMLRATRTEGFGAEVKRRILLGTYALSAGYREAAYVRAQAARAALTHALHRVLAEVDLIVLPTTPTTAFRLGEKTADPVRMYASDLFTVLANLTGAPAMNVPAGWDDGGLPIGVQLVAARGRDGFLLGAARLLHAVRAEERPWPESPPEAGS